MKKSTLAIFALMASASFAFADTSSTTVATSTIPTATSTQITCIQNALEKRENALITGVDVYNTSVKTALTNRLAGLKSAWAMLDKKTRIEKRLSVYKVQKQHVYQFSIHVNLA